MKTGLIKINLRASSKVTKKIKYIFGSPEYQKNSREVELRGLKLKGNFKNLPNMIFFPDMFDTIENWLPFFMDKERRILDHRNVYILYPRNFGLSDRNHDLSSYGEDVAKDVERFMYNQKMTSATVMGHGLGAKTALLTGCYLSHLCTGFIGLNYSPMNYQYHEFAHTYKNILEKISQLDYPNMKRNHLMGSLRKIIQNPKLFAIFRDNVKCKKGKTFYFNFELDFVNEYLSTILDWKSSYGLFPGRSNFIFPEYSNRVFLSTNTIPMYNICIRTEGYLKDIFTVRGENDNAEENHWIYEDPNTI